jgi:energy-coupling factor transport system ATP-binding protein
MVFQYPEHQLFEETVFDDVAFGPRNLGLPADEVEDRVRTALEFVGLDFAAFAKRSPFRLSGGRCGGWRSPAWWPLIRRI